MSVNRHQLVQYPFLVDGARYVVVAFGGQMAVAILGFGMLAVTSTVLLTQKRLREFK